MSEKRVGYWLEKLRTYASKIMDDDGLTDTEKVLVLELGGEELVEAIPNKE